EEQLRLARLRKFGARSEKLPFHGELFDEAELEVSLEEVEKELAEAEEPKKPRKRRTKADGFNENLPRIQVRLTLDEEEKAGANKTFFSKVKEELDIVPAQARVIEYWQEKAVFEQEDGAQQLACAARPVHPLGKCQASVRLLAWILVAKYADALPLYRLEGILKRHGCHISRTTMANWIIRLDDVFKPLINLLRDQQLGGDYLQADETRLQVLKETGKVAQSDKWMWVIRGGPPDQPVVRCHYDPSRSEEVPLRLLDGF
ncbi:transposase, partial [Thiolapillus sp.]|uniref:transposase n=1 Tax=Thiolapillus sp. TaxID=2017437 RepID=UPI003AF5FFB8